MRPGPQPAPERAALLALPLHVVVRDYPETLALLRAAGIDPAAWGGRSLAEAPGGEAVVPALLEATRWRPRP